MTDGTSPATASQPPPELIDDGKLTGHSVVANSTMNRERVHYIGDRLALLERAATWLTDTGLLVAHFDPATLRRPDGTDASRPALAALRAAGFEYSARHHRLSLRGGRSVTLPFTYLGADPDAGPNYTGQPAVASYYRQGR